MSASEKTLWQGLRQRLGRHGKLQRIENLVDSGTPDVAYCVMGEAGWIELKHVARWPARASTPVRLTDYTLEQATWLYDWQRAGGNAFLLVRVGREPFLFLGAEARELYFTPAPKGQFQLLACKRGWDDVIGHFTGDE